MLYFILAKIDLIVFLILIFFVSLSTNNHESLRTIEILIITQSKIFFFLASNVLSFEDIILLIFLNIIGYILNEIINMKIKRPNL